MPWVSRRGERCSPRSPPVQHPNAAPQHFDAGFLEQFPNEQIAIKAGVHHLRAFITLS
jgi:hypothetical protein